ncbi:TonB-dependent receptor [Sphingobium sp. TB-6]|uniref:TonB-dependent receptor domain-containing protein n=1 Tax=Sphingobium sp. TB-6 TaxID=2728850 RepID=UPI00146F5CA6|nr:TonB-dependent receptor [Sphingobium sp. TB-6]NML91832.1 TonB-dependent receptor [Sphingobium sp. TB-6]
MAIRAHWSFAVYLGSAAVCGFTSVPADARTANVKLGTQPLDQALRSVARQTGTNILFTPESVRGLQASALEGTLSGPAAVTRLLRRSGLSFVTNSDDTILIRPISDAGPAALRTQKAVAPLNARTQSDSQIDGKSATPVQSTEGGLEEIVVTATRREERLQSVPTAVTAVTSKLIGATGIVDIRNLTAIVPGFQGGRNNGTFQPSVRGVGSTGVSVGDESNVATYIDGIYQPDPYSTLVDLVEVERVEVLRGPQGTVFGRNATGGLINVITPDPSFTPRGRVALRYGRMRNDANDYDLRGYVTGGLSSNLAADFAGMYRDNDGYIKDLVRGGYLGGARVVNLRSKFMFQPDDDVKIILSGDYANQKSRLNAWQPYQDNTAARTLPNVILPSGPWEASLSTRPKLDFERYNFALRTHFGLGSVNLETSTGYMHNKTYAATDSDASNIFLGQNLIHGEVESISQEVRLLSNSAGPLKWIVGGYAFHLKGAMDILLQSSNGLGTVQSTSLLPQIETTSYAGFAEGTYEAASNLFVTLGARYTTEEKKLEQVLNGADITRGGVSKDFDKFTYRAVVRYQLTDRTNIYASYGTGYKSGVFNASSTRTDAVGPETIKAIEIGLKSDPLPWLRTNLAAFRYDYQNLQVNARDPNGLTNFLQNAANAKLYGGEAEITIIPVPNLNLRSAISYLHAKYDKFELAQTYIPLPQGGNSSVTNDVSGKWMIRAPRLTISTGLDWSRDFRGGLFSITANILYSTKIYYDFLNLSKQKPYALASGQMSWEVPDSPLKLSLWGTNLANAKVFQQIRPGSLDTDVLYEQPRRVGIGAEFKF